MSTGRFVPILMTYLRLFFVSVNPVNTVNLHFIAKDEACAFPAANCYDSSVFEGARAYGQR
jgi:hypothetical protein